MLTNTIFDVFVEAFFLLQIGFVLRKRGVERGSAMKPRNKILFLEILKIAAYCERRYVEKRTGVSNGQGFVVSEIIQQFMVAFLYNSS